MQRKQRAVHPGKQGTKVAAHYQRKVGGGQTMVICLRLSKVSSGSKSSAFLDDATNLRFRRDPIAN